MDIEQFRWSKGRSETKYTYTLSDIARLKGVKVPAIRKAIQRNRLNPADLASVISYIGKVKA